MKHSAMFMFFIRPGAFPNLQYETFASHIRDRIKKDLPIQIIKEASTTAISLTILQRSSRCVGFASASRSVPVSAVTRQSERPMFSLATVVLTQLVSGALSNEGNAIKIEISDVN